MKDVAGIAERAIAAHIFPGCVVGIRHAREKFLGAFGRHTFEADSPAVAEGTVYDIASVTKSVVLATLAHQLLASKQISLTTKLIEYVPEFRGGYREDIMVRHLLTYTIGGLRMSELKEKHADEIMKTVLTFEPLHPPGEKFEYSNVPAFLLGLVLERILGPLDAAADTRIFRPLEMPATTFFPTNAAPTEIDYRGLVQNVVHDESAYVFRTAGKTVGHAGLFSNVPDLMTFLDAFHMRRMDPTLAETNQIPSLGLFAGLGWELNQGHFMGAQRSPTTFGKTGFTGCSVVCDTKREISVVILSNRTFPRRPADMSAINAFRSAVCDIVFS